jgi:uncharacterized protein (DUF58 family)
MHHIQSELCSQACLGESSTRMSDVLGSPRVAPLVLLFSIIFLLLLLLLLLLFAPVRARLFPAHTRCHLAELDEHIFELKIHGFDL